MTLRRFRPALLPTLGAVALVVLTSLLGRWQLDRAQYKEALRDAAEAAAHRPAVSLAGDEPDLVDLRFRHVAVEGELDAERTLFLDNKFSGGQVGYRVVTPMRLRETGRWILVDRGWIGRGDSYPKPPRVKTPAGRVRIAGIAVVPSDRFVELSMRTETGSVWQNLTVERFRERTGIAALPVMIVALEGPEDGLTRFWERPDFGIDRHRGYAFQWFALAATVLVVWITTNLKRAHA